jgi:hypothetical protein
MVYIGYLCLIAAFVCQVLLGVKAFQKQKILHGILFIICWPFALIYGWMIANQWGVKNIVLAMTVLMVLGFIMYGAFMPRAV